MLHILSVGNVSCITLYSGKSKSALLLAMNTLSIILSYECSQSRADAALFTCIQDPRIYLTIHKWHLFTLDMERNYFVQRHSVESRICDVAAVT